MDRKQHEGEPDAAARLLTTGDTGEPEQAGKDADDDPDDPPPIARSNHADTADDVEGAEDEQHDADEGDGAAGNRAHVGATGVDTGQGREVELPGKFSTDRQDEQAH